MLIALLGRRGRRDVVVALSFVLTLSTGALFISFGTESASETFALLFGDILGVSRGEILPVSLMMFISLIVVGILWRPLLFSSTLPDSSEARGVNVWYMEVAFLLIVALVTSGAVVAVGALLVFMLMVAPPASARLFVTGQGRATALSGVLAVAVIWASIGVAYLSNLPVGFLVGTFGTGIYVTARCWTVWKRRQGSGASRPKNVVPI